MKMELMTAVLCILIAMVTGELVSMKTKAFVPSVFVTAVLFLLGYWTFFPQDMVSLAAFGQPFAGLAMFLLITHMGSLMNIRELLSQWKTVLISIAGVLGILAALLTVGRVVLGYQTVIVGAPPLTGGIVAAVLMQEAAKNNGLEMLSVLAILVYVAQGFVGYPITAVLLKKEGTELLKKYSSASKHQSSNKPNAKAEKKKLFPPMPEKYNTTYMLLLKSAFVAFLAAKTAGILNNALKSMNAGFSIHALVYCLVFGVIFTEIGFLDRQVLNKANSFGLTILALMAFIFDGLKNATPQMLAQVAGPLFGVIFIGVIGLVIFAVIAGKILGESIPMSISIAMNALYGFPPNFVLTEEAIHSLTDNKDKMEYLNQIMMPKMLVGGFTSVTIASVIIGGIFTGMLK